MRLTKIAAPAFLFLLMMALPFFAAAQETQPTATPSPTNIPILGEPTDESGAPALEGAPVLSTVENTPASPFATPTALPGAETTEEVPIVEGPTCPTLVEESFTALEQVCTGLSTGDACIGNGTIEGTSGIDGLQFSQPGDIARVTSFDALNLRTANTPGTVWSVMTIQLELNSTDGSVPVGVQTLLFGNVAIEDQGRVGGSGGAQDATVIAGRGMNVRRAPDTTGVVVWQLQSGEQVLATGRTADREWIRIQIPNEFRGIGWVYAPYLDVEGGAESLPIVNANSPAPELTAPEFGPMQAISLETANFPAECTAAPPSGLLMQTPSGLPDEVGLQVNNAEITFNGAIFLQATAATALQVYVLEGQATVTSAETPVTANAGTFITVSLTEDSNATGAPLAARFDVAEFESLPIRLLDRQFVLTAAAPAEPEGAASNADGFASPTVATGFGTAAPTASPEVCTLTAPDVRNIRSGPGTEFGIVRVLQNGDTVTGIGQARGSDGLPWFQTSDDGWIRTDAVNASASCAGLPSVTPPPTEIPEATSTPEASFLESTTLGAVTCPGGQVSASGTSDGSQLYITLGGEWTIGAGTTATFTTQGGLLRPELGDYIQLVTADGTIIAESNDGRVLTVTFEQEQTFTARFSAANGDVVVMAARCDS